MLASSLCSTIKADFDIVFDKFLKTYDYFGEESTDKRLEYLNEFESKNSSIFDDNKAYQSYTETHKSGSITVEKYEKGMNTPGLLLDRLSILVCKNYLSLNASPSLTADQCNNIVETLTSSLPSPYTLLEKEQVQRDAKSQPFQLNSTLFDLHFANIGMWINQDLLYTTDPSVVSHKRLINYLDFFGYANSRRNKSIAKLDRYFFECAIVA